MLVGGRVLRESRHDCVEVFPSCTTELSSVNKRASVSISNLTTDRPFSVCALLDRLIPQLWHHNRAFQRILLNGDSRRGHRIVSNVPGSSDGRTRWALWPDKQEEDEADRDRGADDDAPGDLAVCHGGSKGEGLGREGVVAERPDRGRRTKKNRPALETRVSQTRSRIVVEHKMSGRRTLTSSYVWRGRTA